MAKFGSRSKRFLAECDPRIQQVFNLVVRHYDCTIYEGRRGQALQDEYYRTGKSKVKYPNSRHNTEPLSMAVHAAPWIPGIGIPWDDVERNRQFAHFVLGVAAALGITLRWGGDWDRDWDTRDQMFHDLHHFEIPREEAL